MSDWAGRRYWIVGASEGLGRALAHRLSAVGVDLALSARDTGRLEALAAELPGRASVLPLDVRDGDAVARAAEAAGRIDGLVYLAAVYEPMAADAWQPRQAEAMIEVGLLGAVRAIGAALPAMVARGEGHVVLVGSLAGYRGLPGAVGYGAAKAGLMSLAETMRADLRRSGVRVQLANPGFIRTRLTAKNDFAMPFLMEPEQAAQEIFELMNAPGFSRSFPWIYAAVFRLARLLPDWLYFPLVRR